MLSSADFESIYQAIDARITKKGEYLLTSQVIKNDKDNNLVWVSELGDQAIPIFTFDREIKYTDTDDIPGTIKTIAGTRIPQNYMLANGSSQLRTALPDLFAEIGTKYGSVDGTHFNLPDLRTKFIYGTAAADLSDVGTTGGEATHALTTAELASHVHNIDHAHALQMAGSAGGNAFAQTSGGTVFDAAAGSPVKFTSGLNSAAAGSGTAHNNLPPYVLMAYIIKVTGASITEKTAKIAFATPNVGDTILVALERGTRRLPRCIGVLKSKNFISTSLDEA